MASIYGGALLTIAFVDGTDFHESARASRGVFVPGLRNAEKRTKDGTYPWLDNRDDKSVLTPKLQAARPRPRPTEAPEHSQSDLDNPGGIYHPQFDPRNPESIYHWLDETSNFPSRPGGEHDERTWAFQERLLSRRILNVTRRGLLWDCLRLNACDWRPLGFRGDPSPRFWDSDERKVKSILFGRKNPPHEDHVPSKRLDAYCLWRRLLQDYSSRQFTDPGDRIIAIYGVMQQMRVVLDNEGCFLGIWRRYVIRSLIWFVEPDKEKYLVVNEESSVVAPSWAWASVPDPIQYRLWHPFARYMDNGI